ncbi:MAG: N-6 DNA methylase [Ktedonobacteraceae bacterium]|nr:N-6 DNA methylase [Ktedonobacteraceae bacterium]
MLSPKLKQQVSNLWDMFWSAGMTNPLTSIEQITYLIFLKRLEALDAQRLKEGKSSLYGPRLHCELDHHPQDKVGVKRMALSGVDQQQYNGCEGHGTCSWTYLSGLSTITDSQTQRTITPYDHMNSYVFPWLRVLHNTLRDMNHSAGNSAILGAPMEDAFFQFPKDKIQLFQDAVEAVDRLFAGVSHASGEDLMGDIFEFLLSEIHTSGKNGQFRTPRHIIRFLLELVQPELGHLLIDPTAGTAGFLINDLQYLKRQYTSEEQYVLEWDGTPHRTILDKLVKPEEQEHWNRCMQGEFFVGYDNDRTMVRIGWMNMILHGIENPHVMLRDTLGRSLTREESGRYNRVVANPPYTGTIDKADLYLDFERFPKNPRKANEAITYKTELLFTWLILDLLVPGGKAAVIVPEGVLFGSTGAHKELRRQLLFDHFLEGVISLPAGVFQPYTGVKTSVLIFQKGAGKTARGRPPRTEHVWFYEVASDGYDLGAKRDPDYTHNDLWDALYKWPEKVVDSSAYFQPEVFDARWRALDSKLRELFPKETRGLHDADLGIHELFGFSTPDPKVIEQQIIEQQLPRIKQLYRQRLDAIEAQITTRPNSPKSVRDLFERDLHGLDQLFRAAIDKMLENKKQYKTNPTFGRDRLQPLLDASTKWYRQHIQERIDHITDNIGLFAPERTPVSTIDWQTEINSIVHEFAKLDGYDIKLRTIKVTKREDALPEPKSWLAPVRVLLQNDEWQSSDDSLQGSHDADGRIRPEYLADDRIYDDTEQNIIKKDLLDPNCIEANDYNLSAGRYKPFKPVTVEYDPPAKLIRELQDLEGQIMARLGSLLEMVEGRG